MRKRAKKPLLRKIVLRLPDLDHAKSSVLNSLSSQHSRRNYKFAMEQFITWYCSEPRLALNRIVVLRFRLHLESLGLAASTINQRLAAVRRLAYEAADSGVLSTELGAGIRRVKGVEQLGSRAGNWLNREQARLLLEKADGEGLRSVRDVAMISILLAGVYKLSESFWGRPFLVNGLGVGAWYDLTDCRDELLEVEEREEALLQWAHSGKTGEGGRLPLALPTRIDNQSFSDAS